MLASSSCVKSLEMKMQAKKMYSIRVVFKSFLFFNSFAALYLSSYSVSKLTGGGQLLSRKWIDMDRGEGVENWLGYTVIYYG